MSKADKLFVNMCNDILTNGTSTEGEKVRPHWEDGTPAYTIKKFGVINRYDLREEFPAITLRRTAIKSAIEEVLWIYQLKSNNVHDLKTHIWDQWADKDGSIGKAYGYQVGKEYVHHFNTVGLIHVPVKMNQIDAVIYDLKNNPFSRRIMLNLWNFDELHEMHLYPCAYSCTFNVTEENGNKVLNMILNQRSQDILAANNWNVVQYAALQMMIAQVCDMIPGEFIHVIADAHIYDRHINIIKELCKRPQYDAPIVTLDKSIKNFYDFTPDSFIIEHYQHNGQVKNIPIAI